MPSFRRSVISSSLTLAFLAGASLTISGCVITNGDGDETGTTAGTGSQATSTAGGTQGSGSNATGSGTGDNTGNPGGGLGNCDRTLAPTQTVKGRVDQDTTWSGVVLLEGQVRVGEDVTLTILPGTTVLAKPGSGLEVGYLTPNATFIANGTADQPIHVCGMSPGKGTWGGIQLNRSGSNLSSIAYLSIADAGVAGQAALNLAAQVKIDTVSVENCGGDGVWATSWSPASTGLSVTGCDAPVRLKDEVALNHFPKDGVLTGNTKDMVLLDFARISVDVTMSKLAVPYLQLEDMLHEAQAVWTIDPGVQYKVSADRKLQAGYLGNKTTVQWKGTAGEPIVFSGETEAAGSWKGIELAAGTTSNSEVSGVMIKHAGGSSTPSLTVNEPITLADVGVEDGKMGIEIGSKGLSESSARLSVLRVADHPIKIKPQAITSVPGGGTFTDNAKNSVYVESGSLDKDGTISALPIPYHMSGDFRTSGGIKLTVEAGANFEMSPDSKIEFGYLGGEDTITAVGTAAAPIVFKGAESKAGFWKHIYVGRSVTSNSKFDFVTISDGGQGPSPLLELQMSLPVTNSTFKKSAGWGIRRREDNSLDYETSNTFEEVPSGNVVVKD